MEIDVLKSFNNLLKERRIESILNTNSYTGKFSLQLTSEDALKILDRRIVTLKEQERVDFRGDVIDKLIFSFCDSCYIDQDNYVETLIGLQEIFYYYKNESLDECSDDELIKYMTICFNGVCQGSLENLYDTVLENFARDIRNRTKGFIGRYKEDE